MQAVIRQFVQYLIRREVIREEDAEIYQYGFWSAFLLAVNVLVSVLLFAVTGHMLSGLLYMGLLISLRSYAGGYHSDSALLCFFLSQSSLLASAFLAEWLCGRIGERDRWYFFVCAALMALVIIHNAPCEVKENPLSEAQKRLYQKIVAFILSVLAVWAAVRSWMGYDRVLAVWCVLDLYILITYLAAAVKDRKYDKNRNL